MIGMITGQVRELNAPVACVMTSGGTGYDIELSVPSFCTLTLGSQVTLFTHLYVREDAQLLFGFCHKSEREAFRKLIKITGVGAKMALAILSTLSIDELKFAVEHDDDSALTRVAGVGKKTAQRLIIELKGKLTSLGDGISDGDMVFVATGDTAADPQNRPAINPMHVIAETESALVNLGYKEKEAQAAIKSAKQSLADDELSTSALLKASLKILSNF